MTRPIQWVQEGGFVPGRIDCDTQEKLEMQLWISRHPALAKALVVYRRAEAEERAAEHALHLTYDLLEEQWNGERGPQFSDEGRLGSEVSFEEEKKRREQGKQKYEEAVADNKAQDDLREAIAKYGVKVPAKKKAEKPADEAPVTPPESKP